MKTLFPDGMGGGGGMTLENVAARFTYFHEQLHLLHWQTQSYAEHMALGGLYDYVHDLKDEVVEKIMGYSGRRPSVYKLEPLTAASSLSVVSELLDFASSLKSFAESNSYLDISNLADSLSGEAAKVKYLLTLS